MAMDPNRPNVSRRQILTGGAAAVGGIAAFAGVAAGMPRNTTASGACSPVQPGGTVPVQEIARIMRTNDHMLVNGVLVLSLGRKDLNVTGPNGHPFKPAFGPGHEFFFEPLNNGQVIMNAEFTFIAGELNATMKALLSSPLEIMAQHQHYIGESPQTFHYHFRGTGKAVDVARWAMNVVQATGTPLPQNVPAKRTTPLPHAEMARIIGGQAHVADDGVVVVMRPHRNPETFVEDGAQLKPQANVLHKIDFEPLNNSGSQANCGADFIMVSGQVNPALDAAQKNGFQIHCLYNQQTDIDPQPYFSHTLQAGDPVELAHRVRDVLDAIDAAPVADPSCSPQNRGLVSRTVSRSGRR